MTGTVGSFSFSTVAHVIRSSADPTILASDYETSAQPLMSDFSESSDDVGTVSLDAAGQSILGSWLRNNWVDGEYVFIGIQTNPLILPDNSTTRVYRYGSNAPTNGWTAGSTDARLGIYLEEQISYADWALDFGVGPMDEDFDGDGLSNLFEYALGGDPTVADDPADLLPTLDKTDDGLKYVYRRRQNPAEFGLLYTVETTTNLATDIWNDNGTVELEPDAINEEFDSIMNSIDTTDEPQLFIRLNIEAE
jgi:hypothetical protein